MIKYAVGIDFGTLSARAALFDILDGRELASEEFAYTHGVMEERLPHGAKLGEGWALQHPNDYIEVIDHLIPVILGKSGAKKDDIIALGIDFTSCTVLPAKADGTPLCFMDEFKNIPHAYVKIWKDHTAQKFARLINERAIERNEQWLPQFGGKISAELFFPKLLEIYIEQRSVYDSMDVYLEAGDWLVWQLTGNLTRSTSAAGFTALYNKRRGYPDNAFFGCLAEGFGDVVEKKLKGRLLPIGEPAGRLCESWAGRLGLSPNTVVAVNNMDSQVAVPAAGLSKPGQALAIMGTSTVFMLVGEEEIAVPGIGAVVEDGILPGFFGYAAGQSCVGDHFSWALKSCLPVDYHEAANRAGMNAHEYMRSLSIGQAPGEHGLIALDWWNGNRCILSDAELSGVILGLTLKTKPEDIYRALIEATAYGARKIIDTFKANGLSVTEILASGGIPKKDAMAMQIYADVLGMPVKIVGAANGPALGAAIFASVAAGAYDTVAEASQNMGKKSEFEYLPISQNSVIYNELYREYEALHDYFGRGENQVMRRLRKYK